ncbi:MAG: ethanolamine ammonia-lyase reactivating factor EutA [Candidatus Thorarchaeota archaeon]|nr:ethanolamine ammonia-lyase reactivating factor EutA [Candidatus Thorarchaeota archaeon]
MFVRTERKELTSVGVDIGTATFHIIFSKLLLEKSPTKRTEKFEITKREVVYEGPIHLTPMINESTIDFESLRDFLLDDYASAGFSLEDIDTGAVIITGESARRENAEEIVRSLAGEAGKFVAATAGPNFESVLAAYGAGVVERSRTSCKVIMNVDIGGGSANIAICSDGHVIDTAAINVGGRLLAHDGSGTIVRLENACRSTAKTLGLNLAKGEHIDSDHLEKIAGALADALMEFMTGQVSTDLTRVLMMTPPLRYSDKVDEVTFSGGVAEFIYDRETRDFNDLGRFLARAILDRMNSAGLHLAVPNHLIRATVIGAGQSSLHVSGSTTFLSPGIDLPIRNIPVVEPHLVIEESVATSVRRSVQEALKRFNLHEGEDEFILTFNGAVKPSYTFLADFGKGLVEALPNTIRQKRPILLCFNEDVGNSVGNVMKRETKIDSDVLSIDELHLHEGDFVDIGKPVVEGVVIPVIVKTLVFGDASAKS